jgi:uncharacterized protein
MKHALILHAWYNHPKDQWYPWLAKELEKKGYEVSAPELPTMNTNLPDLARQLKTAEKYVSNDSVVIGHSLGSLLTMRLAEKHSYQKMILVAGWDFNDLTVEHHLYWQTPINHAEIKKHVKEIYVASSDNDPYITAFLAEEMCKRLDGKFILIKGAGHFTKEYGITKIPELIKLV